MRTHPFFLCLLGRIHSDRVALEALHSELRAWVVSGVIAIIAMVAVCVLFITAHAQQIPHGTKADSRVRYVAYDPDNVVVINGFFGYSTYIVFGSGEQITDIAAGDTEGWHIGVTAEKNGFFIKPKQESPQTNITVLTNLRHYNFDMKIGGRRSKIYMVKFIYPADELKKREEALEKGMLQAILSKTDHGKQNFDYWYDGSETLRPEKCWDNGVFTFFKFKQGADFPVIYGVNPDDKSEFVVNRHTEDDTLVVHKVLEKFILRRGNSVTEILNKSFKRTESPDLDGTSSPQVSRTIKGD